MFRRQQRKHLIIQYSLTTLGKIWVQTRPKYCFFIVWLSSSTFSLGLSHTDSYSEIEKGKVFEDPLQLESPPTHLALCGILVNLSDETKPRRQLESLLEFSSGRPLHLIIITDEESIRGAADIIGAVLSRELSFRLIRQTWNKSRPIPPLKVRWNETKHLFETKVKPAFSFVDINGLLPKMSSFVELLKFQSSSSGWKMDMKESHLTISWI